MAKNVEIREGETFEELRRRTNDECLSDPVKLIFSKVPRGTVFEVGEPPKEKPMLLNLTQIKELLGSLRRTEAPVNETHVKMLIASSAICGVSGLQHILGVDNDGIFGPLTKAALDATDTDDLIEEIISSVNISV